MEAIDRKIAKETTNKLVEKMENADYSVDWGKRSDLEPAFERLKDRIDEVCNAEEIEWVNIKNSQTKITRPNCEKLTKLNNALLLTYQLFNNGFQSWNVPILRFRRFFKIPPTIPAQDSRAFNWQYRLENREGRYWSELEAHVEHILTPIMLEAYLEQFPEDVAKLIGQV